MKKVLEEDVFYYLFSGHIEVIKISCRLKIFRYVCAYLF